MENLSFTVRPSYQSHRIRVLTVCLLGTLVGAGCTPVGPDFHPPQLKAPANWHNETGVGLSAETIDPAALARWWTTFNDPVLSNLMARAAAANIDLQLAMSRLHEARARLGVAKADEFPTLTTSGAATRNHSNRQSQNLYNVDFDAGWELDIFGGVRRSVEAATDDLAASQEDVYDVLVSLLGEVATNYIEARTSQSRLAAATANLQLQEDTYQLTDWRYQAGLSDELAVQQARSNLASTRAQLPSLRTGLEGSLNRLAVLIGEEPGYIHDLLQKAAPIPALPMTVTVGVPAETLRQRPDLRRAEWELAAATARIGVAMSDLYPKFRLSGSIGVESADSADILAAASRTWRYGPSFTWPLFDGSQIRRNIEV